MVDFGLAGKVRPAVALTPTPEWNELALVTVVQHTGSPHGDNPWELRIPKSFLRDGVFHLQETTTVPIVRFERRLGALTTEEFKLIKERLRDRLGL
jgi:mRNA interferase MazF